MTEGPIRFAPEVEDGRVFVASDTWPSAAAGGTYRIDLHFAELNDVAEGERVFNVLVQDKKILGDLDIVKQASETNRACAPSIRGIMATDELAIELAPVSGRPPRLSALAITREAEQKD